MPVSAMTPWHTWRACSASCGLALAWWRAWLMSFLSRCDNGSVLASWAPACCNGEGEGRGVGGGEGGEVSADVTMCLRQIGLCAVWCGVVRCGAVQCGAVRCGAVRCGAVRCGAVRCGAVRCGAVWCGAVRCGVV